MRDYDSFLLSDVFDPEKVGHICILVLITHLYQAMVLAGSLKLPIHILYPPYKI
jgi:hypothetical protein